MTSCTAAVLAVSLATSATAAPAAASFSLTALGKPGQHVSLGQYRDKPVIVNFWASWCVDCQTETPLLASWYKEQDGHVTLLGLDENDTAAARSSSPTPRGSLTRSGSIR